MYASLGATFHLHFWQNGLGLLHATPVTWRWNALQIRVSSGKGKHSCCSCWDLKTQPFDHESNALPPSYTSPHLHTKNQTAEDLLIEKSILVFSLLEVFSMYTVSRSLFAPLALEGPVWHTSYLVRWAALWLQWRRLPAFSGRPGAGDRTHHHCSAHYAAIPQGAGSLHTHQTSITLLCALTFSALEALLFVPSLQPGRFQPCCSKRTAAVIRAYYPHFCLR